MSWITLGIISSVLLQVASGSPPRDLTDALTALSVNVKESQNQLPDFLCNEKVTSTTFKSGKKQNEKVVESIFSIRRSLENREILSIDGKPAKKGAKMPRLPVNIRGSFNDQRHIFAGIAAMV